MVSGPSIRNSIPFKALQPTIPLWMYVCKDEQEEYVIEDEEEDEQCLNFVQ